MMWDAGAGIGAMLAQRSGISVDRMARTVTRCRDRRCRWC